MRLLILQHVLCEPPAAYLPYLENCGEPTTVLLGRDPLPPLEEFSAIVAMGGPMSVNDVDTYPWLSAEVDYIAAAVAAAVPYWGVCLGAQLLAAALGSKVYEGPRPEVGVAPVSLTDEGMNDPVLASLPETFDVLQWHSDTFDLPTSATLLAGSTHYANQAFRHGSAYGLQFHLETPADLALEWLKLAAYRNSLHDVLGPNGTETLIRSLQLSEDLMLSYAGTVMQRWLDRFVARGAPGHDDGL